MNQSLYGNIIFLPGGGGNHLRWLLYIDKKFPNVFDGDKLNFIKNQVYNSNRTWHNWISYEGKFRDKLNYIIQISHVYKHSYQKIKELYLVANNIDIPINHYYSINLSLTGNSFEKFYKNFVTETNGMKNITINDPSIQKIVSGDFLHLPILCKNTYKDIIDFYEFDNNYDTASEIHQLYYKCRIKSLQDFYYYFNSTEWKNRFENIRKQIDADS